jgi:hypothetical protein
VAAVDRGPGQVFAEWVNTDLRTSPSSSPPWPSIFPIEFESGLPESDVFERALERGLEDLWEDLVLAQYLDGALDREEAVARVGRTTVERAEREREVVEEDVDWGLHA